MFELNNYSAIIFDCDGVILNSNQIKTEAFKSVASQFGAKPAQLLVDFHIKNGGISRYKKFEHLLSDILAKEIIQSEIDDLAGQFSEYVYQELLTCPVASGLETLRKTTSSAKWFIVSGGDQKELRRAFSARGISDYFDGGIFGSPENKDEILANLIKDDQLQQPSLFVGDSRYDYEAAKLAGLDFIFIYEWSEFSDWKIFCVKNNIRSVRSVEDVINHFSLYK